MSTGSWNYAENTVEPTAFDDVGKKSYGVEAYFWDEMGYAHSQGSVNVSKEKVLGLFRMGESYDASEIKGTDSEGFIWSDGSTAVYALLEDNGTTVGMDVKSVGDLNAVVRALEMSPSEFEEAIETVSGNAWREAYVRADERDVDSEVYLDAPGETSEGGFTNAQFERSVRKARRMSNNPWNKDTE
ncbi:MAG: hypothetical protein ABEJ83_02060 [Candidatus Nanohaloarchaea archaeon]